MKLKFLSILVTGLISTLANIATVTAEAGLVGACRNGTIDSVPDFSPQQYLGRWYEIGRSRSFVFENNCERSVADYTPEPDHPPGETVIRVNNSCLDRGRWRSAIGKGQWQPPGGRFLVNFFGPFEAPYDVVHLEAGYQTALVASCSELGGSNLWILHREPIMGRAVADQLVAMFRDLGFVTDDLELVSVVP